MRFICDSTVGKLTRLLRMAGYDTAYVKEPGWRKVVKRALGEKRIILSRNSLYSDLKLAPQFLLLHDDSPEEQFRVVVREYGLKIDPGRFLSRCLECNGTLVPVEVEAIRERLWDYVAESQDSFFLCETCDRVYWHGTHARAMTDRLLKLKEQVEKRDS